VCDTTSTGSSEYLTQTLEFTWRTKLKLIENKYKEKKVFFSDELKKITAPTQDKTVFCRPIFKPKGAREVVSIKQYIKLLKLKSNIYRMMLTEIKISK
jgi:hypothetical protein